MTTNPGGKKNVASEKELMYLLVLQIMLNWYNQDLNYKTLSTCQSVAPYSLTMYPFLHFLSTTKETWLYVLSFIQSGLSVSQAHNYNYNKLGLSCAKLMSSWG
jgi:hypothetical protein